MKIIHLRANLAMNWRLYRLMLVKFPSQGFTMLEVLVAILMVFGFLMGTLNAMLAATVMQIKAERQAQATYWIQEDLENVRAAAGSQAADTIKCTSAFSTSYAGALNTSTVIPVIKYETTDSAPSYSIGASVLVATVTASSVAGKSYTMTRTTGGSNTNPNLLTISYTVNNSGDPDAIATLYTEVIPAQALSCP